MTEHKAQKITAEHLRHRLEARFAQLHYNDQYNGRHEEEFTFLENVLADQISEGADASFMDETVFMQSCKSILIVNRFVLSIMPSLS